MQRTASSSSLASSNGTSAEVKLEPTKSLIDFDDDPAPPVAPAIPQPQQTTVTQPVMVPANLGDNNWASFDVAPEAKAAQGPSNVNRVESLLSQLSVPVSLPAHVSGAQGGPHLATTIPLSSVTTLSIICDSSVSPAGPVTGSPLTATAAGAPSVSSFSTFPSSSASVTSPGLTTLSPLNNAGQWASLQYQQPSFPATVSQRTSQQVTPPVGGALNNQVCFVLLSGCLKHSVC